jgi:cellobiose-specific phosphotransferase system component IIC
MCSVIGQMIISFFVLIASVVLLFSQDFFLCNEFDGSFVDFRKWWTLADNYETATTGILLAFQIVHISAAYNLGSTYREGFMKNRAFLAMYALFFAMLAFILLADPNPLGCIFRIK